MNKKSKICILGAGAAGLSAAHFLKKKGFDVTILERNGRVGGKCWTLDIDDKSYEMGAGIVSYSYATMLEIMKDMQVKSDPLWSAMYVDIEKKNYTRIPQYINFKNIIPGLKNIYNLNKVFSKNSNILKPGLCGIDRDLSYPFEKFANKNNLEMVQEAMAVIQTAFGYGYNSEVPAIYVLKYVGLIRPLLPVTEFLKVGGTQKFWQKVASQFEIFYDTNIKSIKRGKKITIETESKEFKFDYLLISSPLDETKTFMDLSNDELALFSRIRYYDYHVYCCTTKNLPKIRYGFIPSRQHISEKGRTMFWYRRWPKSNIITFYGLGKSSIGMSAPMNHEKIRKNIIRDVETFGGKIESFNTDHIWKYFPHFSSIDIRKRSYEKLEALQGKKNTFYIGEVMNFSTMENVSSYSKQIVNQHFN